MTEPNGVGARVYHLERWRDETDPTVNDLVVHVALIQRDIKSIAKDIGVMREEAEKRQERETTSFRWRMSFAGVVVMAILGAAGIVASAIQSGVVLP